jgi:uncharacterized membrane protein YhfC
MVPVVSVVALAFIVYATAGAVAAGHAGLAGMLATSSPLKALIVAIAVNFAPRVPQLTPSMVYESGL